MDVLLINLEDLFPRNLRARRQKLNFNGSVKEGGIPMVGIPLFI